MVAGLAAVGLEEVGVGLEEVVAGLVGVGLEVVVGWEEVVLGGVVGVGLAAVGPEVVGSEEVGVG